MTPSCIFDERNTIVPPSFTTSEGEYVRPINDSPISPKLLYSHSPLNSGNLKAGTLKILALDGSYISLVYRLNYYRVMTEKSIKEVSDLWKRDKKQYVKQSTYAAYILILENHILPAFEGNTTISEDDVQAFVFNKLESGMRQKTVRDIVIVLKMVVRYGAKLGLDWKSDWQLHYPTTQSKDAIEVLSIENHRKIMNYIQGNFTFKNLGVYVCLSSGLRIGEICALKWEDIDVRESVIHVRRTLERVYVMDEEPRRTVLIEGMPKTVNSVRDIPITKNLMKMLKPLCGIVNPDYYVLSNESKPIEPRTYRNYYKALMQELGIPRIKFHGLRHSFATRCIESNCDYKTVSVLLGHSNIGTTLNLYVHPNLEQKKKCLDKAFRFMK